MRKTWAEISSELGFHSRDGARLAVGRLVRSTPRNHVAERAITVEKLRVQESLLFPMLQSAVDRGDVEQSVLLDKELRLLSSDIAKIDGHAAPQRTQVDVTMHRTPREIIAETKRQLLAVLAQRQPALTSGVIDAEVVE